MDNRVRSILARVSITLWIAVGLGMAACMPVMPEGADTPATTVPGEPATEATPAATEEATEEATAEPTEEGEPESTDAAGMDIAAQLVQSLADELQIATTRIAVVTVEAVEWPDACLGVYAPDVMCAQVITPGYLIVLEVDGAPYEYHTNSDGTSIQLAAAPEAPGSDEMSEGIAFVWYREGGIAGFCDLLTAYVNGQLEAATCFSDPPQPAGSRPMSAAETEQLRTWLAEYAPFEYRHDDGDVEDGMTIELRFAGEGDTETDLATQEQIALTAQEWHASITQ